ncbi:di-heme oxidoreductase family protein [Vibrio algarum]|uniref:Di-heme oxidoredictase family protein n=1 Tax=Vibrio algarum TaxID=3020714 RepID=A0ABT4YWD6_9VIBR|nr:di-heme oxidoredictase family protein [Vibrio sp. KJ40-1]MDB1125881.1 di-heme oxidoredictase family protein [Vibrio sp. KJ40-1]
MKKSFIPLICVFSVTVFAAEVDQKQHLSAGDTSVKSEFASAFSSPSANMKAGKSLLQFHGGNKFFEEPWAQSAGSVSSQDGLGPLFNNNACQDCHVRDGRGHASESVNGQRGTDFNSMLLRASKSDISEEQKAAINQSLVANVPDTCIGGQLQHQANFGIKKEASQAVSYDYQYITFADGDSIELRKPIWHIKANGCEINDDTVLSARVAPPMIGLGLLALIDAQQVIDNQDIDDKNNDGISGRANFVWSIADNGVILGRFGWKAGQPTIHQQVAGAFLGDMGLTTELFKIENCMPKQKDCLEAPTGNSDTTGEYNYEVSSRILDKVTFYSNHLSVPQRRNAYAEDVLAGKALFNEIGCNQCHNESYTTVSSVEFPELSEQKIYPYTDMLLHDMGIELTDFDKNSQFVKGDIQVEFLAQANEWRTPPLWGLGLTQTVDPNATFLHDGRARTIMEAILWHGGEAQPQQQAVLKLDKTERENLIRFLRDL